MRLSLVEIASICGGEVVGDASKQISGVNTIENAGSDEIVFVLDSKYAKYASNSKAGAVICRDRDRLPGFNLVLTENPQLAFVALTEKFHPEQPIQPGTGDLSRIHHSVHVPDTSSIGQFVSIGEDVFIGDNVSIGDGAKIEAGSRIGAGTVIHQNVIVKSGTEIGSGCRIHPGVVLGADGFGLVKGRDAWRRIPQVGRLIIGDNVDIGANTTVDRGSLGNTVLGNGVKLDNLIQIGHNVRIGQNTVIAAHTAIAGSSIIGENCEIGGCVGVMDHSTIVDNVKIGGGSVISGRISEPGIYSSSIKAEALSTWQKNAAWIRKLSTLADRIRKLEKK